MAWQTTWNGAWKTSLASALTSYTVRLGPVANVDPDGNAVATIFCTTKRAWLPSQSPTGNRTYDLTVFLGVVIQGMDDAGSVDDLWNAMDTVEDAVWTLLAPGTFRASQRIDSVVSIESSVATARTGVVAVTLRVRRS